MLERWLGEPGEAAAFAASLLAKPGGDQGKIDYVSVAARAATASTGVDDVMKWSGIDYKALIAAYEFRDAGERSRRSNSPRRYRRRRCRRRYAAGPGRVR